MENILAWVMDKLGWIAAFMGAGFAYVFGAWDALIAVLLVAVIMDYATGIINAALKHELSSSVGFRGLAKKLYIFCFVALGTMADYIIPATNGALRVAVCGFYIANEMLSIIENAGEIGVPYPAALKNALERLRSKNDTGEDEGE